MTVEWRMQNPHSSDPDSPPHQCTQRTLADAMQTQGNACTAKHIIAVWAFFFRPGHDSEVGKKDVNGSLNYPGEME